MFNSLRHWLWERVMRLCKLPFYMLWFALRQMPAWVYSVWQSLIHNSFAALLSPPHSPHNSEALLDSCPWGHREKGSLISTLYCMKFRRLTPDNCHVICITSCFWNNNCDNSQLLSIINISQKCIYKKKHKYMINAWKHLK